MGVVPATTEALETALAQPLASAGPAPARRTVGAEVPAWVERAIWAFVALGVLLRVVRYLLRHPIWGDEAFVAVNLLTRDYAGLLRPLDHDMICPLFFLWVERLVVDCLGFSEYSLRLFPTVCGVLSVVLFRYAAGRVVRGPALLVAVAILAVSVFPIRHGGDVKPYATDLLVGIMLWFPALEWWRSRDDRWLWRLTAVVPILLAFSHPAIFVAGGVSLGLVLAVRRARSRGTWLAFLAYNAVVVGSFVTLFVLFTGPQRATVARPAAAMMKYWESAFPPRGSLPELVVWFVRAHTGHMFAYPVGGDRGASLVTAGLVLAGLVTLMRRRQGTLVALCLAPFGLTLAAAMARCYPYGGSTRTMLFLAPVVCLLSGIGAASLLERIKNPARYRRGLGLAAVALGVFGGAALGVDVAYPFYSQNDVRSREFAQRFWAEQAEGADLVCLRSDLGIAFKPTRWHLLRTPVYLCNQAIYSGRRGREQSQRAEGSRPLRCVLFNERPLAKTNPAAWEELPLNDPRFLEWLGSMQERYELRDIAHYGVNEGAFHGEVWFEDRYVVLEFVPKRDATAFAASPMREGDSRVSR